MLRLIAASGAPMRRVLDLGCGDGILSRALADRHHGVRVVLMDFNDEMLRAARERFQGIEAEYVLFDYGDPDWTSRVSGPFDAIVSGYSIHHQPDERKREIYSERSSAPVELFGASRGGGR